MSLSDLERVFESFGAFGNRTSGGAELDNVKFSKLCRDCQLLDNGLTPSRVDLIFAKVKSKGARKINFKEFIYAIELMAEAKYGADPNGVKVLREAIVTAGGPQLGNVHLPQAQGIFDRLTDSRLYTGSHKNRFDENGQGLGLAGRDSIAQGAGTVSGYHEGNVSDLSQITRPSFRGGTHMSDFAKKNTGNTTSPRSPTRAGSAAALSPHNPVMRQYSAATLTRSPSGFASPTQSAQQPTRSPARPAPAAAPPTGSSPRVVIDSAELHSVFLAYCAFGTTSKLNTELDSAKFAKLCRESGIIDGKNVPPSAVDVAFSKCKQKGRRTITYSEFQQALAALAPQKYPNQDLVVALQSTVESIILAGGPSLCTNSLPETGGVFDKLTDTRLYTGSHKERFDNEGRGLGKEGRY